MNASHTRVIQMIACNRISVLRSRTAAYLGLFAMLAVFGCGEAAKPTAELSGKVMVKGKPLASGGLVLLSDDGRIEAAPVKDGNYSTKAAPTGKIKITVSGGG